jgi:hypothetical protein
MAGLCAQVDALGNPNVAAAGRDFAISYVQGFNWYGTPPTQTSDANVLLLNEAGINSFEQRYGVTEAYGFSTAATTDPIYWQASAARMRMALVADAYSIGEPYTFRQIDGKGSLAARFGGEITGQLLAYYDEGALYGGTAPDAFTVNTGPSVNTSTTAAAGKLKATVGVRYSPFAQEVEIDLYAAPVTQPLP